MDRNIRWPSAICRGGIPPVHRQLTDCRLPCVLSIAPTGDGFLLVLTSGGLARYRRTEVHSAELSASALGFGPDSDIWLATPTGFLHIQPGASASGPRLRPSDGADRRSGFTSGWLSVGANTHSLPAMEQGRLRYLAKRAVNYRELGCSPFSRIHVGTLWVGTDQGLVALSSASTADNRDFRYNLP